MKRPLYVEFVGLAGAGKSTVANEVMARMVAANYRCVRQGAMGHGVVHSGNKQTSHVGRGWKTRNRWDRLLSYLFLHLGQWRVSTGVFQHAYATGQLRKFRVLRTLPLVCQRVRKGCDTVRAGYGDVIVFDQGIVHSLRKLAIIGSPTAEAGMTRVIRAIADRISPARVVFVLFILDADTAVNRIRQRPVALGRYDRLSPDQARQELALQAPCSEYVVDLFSRIGIVDGVLRVDATRSPTELADEITGYIQRHLEPGQLGHS